MRNSGNATILGATLFRPQAQWPRSRSLCGRQDCLQPNSFGGGFLVTRLEDMHLRDLDDTVIIEATCMRCLHVWLQSPVQLLIKVDHRDGRLDEVAKNLACPK